jgi:hypothetical protein
MGYTTESNSFTSQYLLNIYIYCGFCRLCTRIINVSKKLVHHGPKNKQDKLECKTKVRIKKIESEISVARVCEEHGHLHLTDTWQYRKGCQCIWGYTVFSAYFSPREWSLTTLIWLWRANFEFRVNLVWGDTATGSFRYAPSLRTPNYVFLVIAYNSRKYKLALFCTLIDMNICEVWTSTGTLSDLRPHSSSYSYFKKYWAIFHVRFTVEEVALTQPSLGSFFSFPVPTTTQPLPHTYPSRPPKCAIALDRQHIITSSVFKLGAPPLNDT